MIQSFITKERWPFIAILVSIAMLAAAHFFETVMNLYPCKFCLRQREVYWAAAAIGAVAVLVSMRWPNPHISRVASILLGGVFLTGAGVAGFHAGVEWGFFPALCERAVTDFDGGLLSELEKPQAIGSCDEAPWVFLGLSMAGWNALVSVFLACLSFIAATRSKEMKD